MDIADNSIVLDAGGRLVAYGPLAADLVGLTPGALGTALIDSDAWFLAPLLTDALLGEHHGPQQVALPSGQPALVAVVALVGDRWRFTVQPLVPFTPAPRADSPAQHGANTSPVRSQQSPVPLPTADRELPTADRQLLPAPPAPLVPREQRIEHLLSTSSNHIRTPLLALHHMLDQVGALGTLSEPQQRLIDQALALHARMAALVDGLFTLGHTHLQGPPPSPLRLDLLVEAVAETVAAEASLRGQRITTRIAADLAPIVGYDDELWQALYALVERASRLGAEASTIRVTVARYDAYVKIHIYDGVRAEVAEALEQSSDRPAEPNDEDGRPWLGHDTALIIAKAIIEHHRGRIWATSLPGHSSGIAISLPCS